MAVVARATLAWNDLIKEIASVVDPSLEIRIEFMSGTMGSRSINSVIRAAAKVAIKHPWTTGSLGAIAGVFLLSPIQHAADDVTDHLAEAWFGHQDDALSDNDVQRVAEKVAALQRNKVPVGLKQEIFSEASRDDKITGLGATPIIGRPPPALIIPRASFPAYRGDDLVVQEETVERRTTWKYDYPVAIVRSYSKAEERRWRFEHGATEFSATMRDPDFLAAIKSGHTGVEIGEGVELRVDLRIKEEKIGGVWHEKELDVMKVLWPNIDRQPSIKFPPN
ncbi:MAG: hypothetical protein JNL35_00470 [Sphingopyxis sp.]|nr:hypothetical protein [Sphingopyxis sp.]